MTVTSNSLFCMTAFPIYAIIRPIKLLLVGGTYCHRLMVPATPTKRLETPLSLSKNTQTCLVSLQ